VFALQRRLARRQGLHGGQVGPSSFVQYLQVTPHFHSLVPDGVFVPREGGVRFEALLPAQQLTASHRSQGPTALGDTASTTLYRPSAAHGFSRGPEKEDFAIE
jgi:hypothetical protein